MNFIKLPSSISLNTDLILYTSDYQEKISASLLSVYFVDGRKVVFGGEDAKYIVKYLEYVRKDGGGSGFLWST